MEAKMTQPWAAEEEWKEERLPEHGLNGGMQENGEEEKE